MPASPFTYRFTVPLHDVDAAGIMFFGHLFRHAHDAYEAFMNALGFPLDRMIREGKWLLPLVHAEADYRLPLRHGDSARIRLCVSRVGGTSFSLSYRFADESGRTLAEAGTVHVLLSRVTASGRALPEDLKRALSRWACASDSARAGAPGAKPASGKKRSHNRS
jgi:1,4-dihydroxy-2-naphthoyl-CoA hydrolase